MADKALVYRVSFDGLDKQIDAIGKVDRELSNLTATVKDQRKSLEILEKTNQKNTQEYADLTNELGKNIVQQRNLTKQKGDLIRETQNEAKVNQENEGSIVSLRAQLSNLTKEYNNLTKAERESAKGQDVQKQAKAISDELKSLEGAIGDNRRNVGNYADALKGLSGSLNIAGVNVGGLIDKFQNFRNTAQGIVDALGNTENSLKGNAAATQTFNTASSKSTGILGRVSGALGKFKLALIGTGIGAIVVGFGALIAAFLSTQKGIDTLTRALAPLKVAFETVVGFLQNTAIKVFEQPKEALKDLGDFIVGQFTNRVKALKGIFAGIGDAWDGVKKGFTTGDFSGVTDALSDIGSNVVDFTTGVEGTVKSLSDFAREAVRVGNQISDLEIKVRELTRTNTALIAGYSEEIEALKAIAADTSKTAGERERAGKQAIELIEQRRLAQLELIDAEIQLLELNQSLSDTDAEGLQALEDLRAKRNQINKEAVAGGKEVTGQINAAIQAQVQANKAALDQINAIRQANNLALIEGTEKRTREELRLQNEANLAGVEQLKVSEKLKQQIRDAFNDQYKIAIDQLNADITAKELDAQTQLRLLQIDAQKQTIDDKVALKELELKQLKIQQKRELEIFEGSDIEKKVLLQQQLNDRNALIKESEDLRLKTQRETDEAAAKLREKNKQDELAAIEAIKQKQIESVEQFQNTLNALAQLLDTASALRTQKIQTDAQKEIDAINKLPIAEEEKEKKILAIEAKAEEKQRQIEKQNAQRQKAFAITQALISGALAVVKGIAQFGPPPSPAGIAAIAAAAITTATQIAAISAQKFADGGLIPKDGGWIKGNSHANGGVKFAVGGRVMEAEGGEIIVNKNIQKRPDFVSAISQMNYLTGGKRFEVGGIVAPKFSAAGVSLASQQQQLGGQNFTVEVPAMQVLNNVVDTTSQQSSIIQIRNQTTIGG